MNLAECYRILGLESGASFDAIKASYRRLARRYHPDVNPGNQHAKDKFIELTEAYRFLLSAIPSPVPEPPQATAVQQPSTVSGGTRITR